MDFSWEAKKVVVPGGAGFIGSHVVDRLVEMGAKEVIVIDDLSTGSWDRISGHGDQVVRIEADLLNPLIAEYFAGADVVLNLAGRAPGLTPDPDRHERLYRENMELTEAILSAVLKAKTPHYLLVSSSCVYPDDAPVPTPELSFEGTEPEEANRGYGLAKRESEQRAIDIFADYPDANLYIVRPFNVFGVRDDSRSKSAHVIPSLLARVLDDSPELVVWGSGNQTRSFIHGKDIARGMCSLVEKRIIDKPVNIGSGREIPMLNLVAMMQNLAGTSKKVVCDTSKPEGATRKACDYTLLKQLTGFEPEISFEEGLEEIVQHAMAVRSEGVN